MHPLKRRTGMKEIAAAVGVSLGTVDRALNNRPGINGTTRERILKTARRLGYVPNLAARQLSSRKEIRITVILPLAIASFFDDVRAGIEFAARPFEHAGVRLAHWRYPALRAGEVDALRRALRDDIQGAVICPGDPAQLCPVMQEAADRGIPIVCVGSDAPEAPRSTAISVDPYVNGSVAGELVGRFLGGTGDVIVVTGFRAILDHAEKERGFRDTLTSIFPDVHIRSVLEAHEDETEAYEMCRATFQAAPPPKGLYVTTVNSTPVMRAVDDSGITGLSIVTTDLFPELARRIRAGEVAATILQMPFEQGRMAFEALYRLLVERIQPPQRIRVAPQIVLRSNLDTFLRPA